MHCELLCITFNQEERRYHILIAGKGYTDEVKDFNSSFLFKSFTSLLSEVAPGATVSLILGAMDLCLFQH